MGIDTCIFVKAKENADLGEWVSQEFPEGCKLRAVDGRPAPQGATHEVRQHWRYYSPYYARGPWPDIAAALMYLFSRPDIEEVWYFGDNADWERAQPFTREQVLELCSFYMRDGNRPYYL